MLTKNKHPKFSYAQRICALPIVIVLIAALSLQAKKAMANSFKNLSADLGKIVTNELPSAENIKPDTVNVFSKNAIIAFANESGISEAELKEYYALVSKAYVKEKDLYDFALLSKLEKEKLKLLAKKLNDKQRLIAPLVVTKEHKYLKIDLKKDFKKHWNKWQTSDKFSFRIDYKEVNKEEVFKNNNPATFNSYHISNIHKDFIKPSNNTYEVSLITNEYYKKEYAPELFEKIVYNINKLETSTGLNEATEAELLEVMTYYKNYNPKNNQYSWSNIKMKEKIFEIYNKMSKEQKANSPVTFSSPYAYCISPSEEILRNWSKDTIYANYKFSIDGKSVSRSTLNEVSPNSIVESNSKYFDGSFYHVELWTLPYYENKKIESYNAASASMNIGNWQKSKIINQ